MPLTILDCSQTGVSDLTPLKGLPLASLSLRDAPVTNLAALARMKLTSLDVFGCRKLADLTPLKGMQLEVLKCGGYTLINDLSAIEGMPLKVIEFQENFQAERDAKILRSVNTLTRINLRPAAEFWKDVEEPLKGKKP